MRRRTARNRSTTPRPDTGLPAAPSCGSGRHQTSAPGRLRGCVQRLADGPVSYPAHDPCIPAHAGVRQPAVALRRRPGPGYPRPAAQHRPYSTGKVGVGVGDHLFDAAVYRIRCPARFPDSPPAVRPAPDSFSIRRRPAATIPFGGAPAGIDSGRQHPPAALSTGRPRGPRQRSQSATRGFRLIYNDAADRFCGRPHRMRSCWQGGAQRCRGPEFQRTRRRMNLLPNRVPMVFSSVAAVASL